MLPASNRLRRSSEISSVTRGGLRVRRGVVVVHLQRRQATGLGTRGPDAGSNVPRVGLAVGRAVGGSVVRHRVARRIRAIALALLPGLPDDADIVIRALPAAGSTSFGNLDQDVREALLAACSRVQAG